jgi:2-oxoglutarate dehydrogenase E2 component (dihydrolipoamide succinyltransferase)
MDVIMPQLGETVAEGTVVKWYKKVGDTVKADDVLFDVETDKVSTEIPAQANGVLAEILVGEGTTAKVGTRLAVIHEKGGESGAAQAKAEVPVISRVAPMQAAAAAPAAAGASAAGRLSPVVSRLLGEHGLNAADIRGTGRDGRITREDALAHIEGSGQPSAVSRQSPGAGRPPPVAAEAGTVPLNMVRKRTAEHMAKSWAAIPHVMQAIEADFSKVDEARRAAGAAWKSREGFSLTYLPFIVRAVALALAKYPRLNASFHGDHLVLHKRVNIGIAVDLNLDGLVVPVLKDAAPKGVAQIAKEINKLSSSARASQLRPDDMTEATYTITNNGAFGTLVTAAIISPPQVAILSTDGVKKRAVVVEGAGGDSVAVRPVGVLAQSFDHRAVDGAYSGSFLNEVKNLIETRDWAIELKA